MKTFRLLITIIALGFFSLSCSNEELNLQTEQNAIESDEFARGGDPVLSQPKITIDEIDFNFTASFVKGKLRLAVSVISTQINRVRIKAFNDQNCSTLVNGHGRAINTGLKRNGMDGQVYSGCAWSEEDKNYEFSFTIVSSKEITTAASVTTTVCCPN